ASGVLSWRTGGELPTRPGRRTCATDVYRRTDQVVRAAGKTASAVEIEAKCAGTAAASARGVVTSTLHDVVLGHDTTGCWRPALGIEIHRAIREPSHGVMTKY